jgi:hypothetical protein
MAFDYSKLNGRIIEMFGTRAKFAKEMGMSEHTLSVKMNGKTPWTQKEICKACDLLSIPSSEIHLYFFTEIVQSA